MTMTSVVPTVQLVSKDGGGSGHAITTVVYLLPPHTRRATFDHLLWYNGTAYTYFPHVEMKVRRKSCPKPKPKETC